MLGARVEGYWRVGLDPEIDDLAFAFHLACELFGLLLLAVQGLPKHEQLKVHALGFDAACLRKRLCGVGGACAQRCSFPVLLSGFLLGF